MHVFSASYWSFLLAPLPAVMVARLLGRPVLMNYRSGEAPDHLRRSAIARSGLRSVDRNIVPSRFLQRFLPSTRSRRRSSRTSSTGERFRFRLREPLRPRLLSTRNFEPLYDVELHAARVCRGSAALPRRDADARRRRLRGASLRRLAAELGLRGVAFAGRVAPERHAEGTTPTRTSTSRPRRSTTCRRRFSRRLRAGFRSCRPKAGGVPAMLTDERPRSRWRRSATPSRVAAQVVAAPRRPDVRPAAGPRRLRHHGCARRGIACAIDGCAVYRELAPRQPAANRGPGPYELDARAQAAGGDGPPRDVVSRLDGRVAAGGPRRLHGATGRNGGARRWLDALGTGPPVYSPAIARLRQGDWLGAHHALMHHIATPARAVRPRRRRHGPSGPARSSRTIPARSADAVRLGDRVAAGSSISSAIANLTFCNAGEGARSTGSSIRSTGGARHRPTGAKSPISRLRAAITRSCGS